MRRLGALAAVLLLSGCFIEPRSASLRTPLPEPEARRAYGPEFGAVAATDDVIQEELARASPLDASAPGRYDRAARRIGLSNGAELVAIMGRDCLEPCDLARVAAARNLRVETAGRYLETRFGVRVCAGR